MRAYCLCDGRDNYSDQAGIEDSVKRRNFLREKVAVPLCGLHF